MKTLILAGGIGTRLSEETTLKPKPLVEIGGKPILWHIMKGYSQYGHNDFVVLLGYKGYLIKEYFANYFLHQSDVTIDILNNKIEVHSNASEPWKITLIDTGLNSGTGSRIKQAKKHLNNERFMMTYGDGVANINVNELISYHENNDVLVTMSSVQPAGKFGAMEFAENNKVKSFIEKPKGDSAWINGGFFVCELGALDYIDDNPETMFERSPLEKLAKDGHLGSYKHEGFWRCMDTLRDKHILNDLWNNNEAPWKTW